jgi:HTH-type transcriptional regulator/antitoxin HigA
MNSILPVIRSDSENERLIAEMERIDSLPNPTPEEKDLAEFIGLLVETNERRYELGHADPIEALKHLMEDRGMRQRDLIPAFGSSSVASDVLNGKREIGKRHARGLAVWRSRPFCCTETRAGFKLTHSRAAQPPAAPVYWSVPTSRESVLYRLYSLKIEFCRWLMLFTSARRAEPCIDTTLGAQTSSFTRTRST